MNNYLRFSKFFSSIQETKWYLNFLSPVVYEIPRESSVLDIGTGTGKLIQLLVNKKSANCIGIDTNQSMLHEAEKKVNGLNVQLLRINSGDTLPFSNKSFDYVTLCNVLFNLSKESGLRLLYESIRVLKPKGKILVLTPTGRGSFKKISKHYLSSRNLSIYLWYYATLNKADLWFKNNYLSDFCNNHGLKYERKLVFDELGLIEIISK